MEKDLGNAVAAGFSADETTTYDYDENDRLTREERDTDTSDQTTFYEYGNSNNGTQQTRKTTYDGLQATEPAHTLRTTETTFEYNAQGRLSKVTIDSNGEASGGVTTYEYEYNDNGIRVKQTITENFGEPEESATVTLYHVDPNNHTGYAQVLEEGVDDSGEGNLDPDEIDKTYTLGHDVISQAVDANTAQFLLYDGHGSTRALLDALAAVVGNNQRFAYDAYGNMLLAGLTGYTATTDAALTSLLYSGEQTDLTGLQYLRARFYDPTTGRFNRLDPFAGNATDPLSLHKYLYVHDDPINAIDPSGQIYNSIRQRVFFLVGGGDSHGFPFLITVPTWTLNSGQKGDVQRLKNLKQQFSTKFGVPTAILSDLLSSGQTPGWLKGNFLIGYGPAWGPFFESNYIVLPADYYPLIDSGAIKSQHVGRIYNELWHAWWNTRLSVAPEGKWMFNQFKDFANKNYGGNLEMVEEGASENLDSIIVSMALGRQPNYDRDVVSPAHGQRFGGDPLAQKPIPREMFDLILHALHNGFQQKGQ